MLLLMYKIYNIILKAMFLYSYILQQSNKKREILIIFGSPSFYISLQMKEIKYKLFNNGRTNCIANQSSQFSYGTCINRMDSMS